MDKKQRDVPIGESRYVSFSFELDEVPIDAIAKIHAQVAPYVSKLPEIYRTTLMVESTPDEQIASYNKWLQNEEHLLAGISLESACAYAVSIMLEPLVQAFLQYSQDVNAENRYPAQLALQMAAQLIDAAEELRAYIRESQGLALLLDNELEMMKEAYVQVKANGPLH
jgi:hypothetical protein